MVQGQAQGANDQVILTEVDVAGPLAFDDDRGRPVVAWIDTSSHRSSARPMQSKPGPRLALVAGTFTATKSSCTRTSLPLNADRGGHLAHSVGHGDARATARRSASRAWWLVTTMTHAPGTSSLRWCTDWIETPWRAKNTGDVGKHAETVLDL